MVSIHEQWRALSDAQFLLSSCPLRISSIFLPAEMPKTGNGPVTRLSQHYRADRPIRNSSNIANLSIPTLSTSRSITCRTFFSLSTFSLIPCHHVIYITRRSSSNPNSLLHRHLISYFVRLHLSICISHSTTSLLPISCFLFLIPCHPRRLWPLPTLH